jgi:hypothetical protein
MAGPRRISTVRATGGLAMYMRVTTFKIDPASIEQFRADGEEVEKRAKVLLPDIQTQYLGIDDAGNVISIAIWNSQETAEAHMEAVRDVWSGLMKHMRSQPTFAGYGTVEKLR